MSAPDLLGDDRPATTSIIEQRLKTVAMVRAVLVLLVAGYLATAGRDLVTGENTALAMATVVGVLVFSATVPLWPVNAHRAVLDVSLVVDGAAVGILLALTGGAASPFMPLVVLVAAVPLIAFGARTGVRAAVAATVVLGWVWATSADVPASELADTVPRAVLVTDTRIAVALLATWATVVAVALVTRVVETDLRRAADDLDTLHRIGRTLEPEEGPEHLARKLVDAVVAHLDADEASVWLADRTREGLLLAAGTGTGRLQLERDLEVPRTGLVGRALATDGFVVGHAEGAVIDVHGDSKVVAVALRGHAPAPHGVLVLHMKPRRGRGAVPLDARHVQSIEDVASEAGSALDDAHAMAHLRNLARTDAVTGMPNHRVFQERLRIELGRLERRRNRGREAALSLAMLDLDHFKRVNDAHGHPTGDAVLAAVAEAVDRAARAADVVCRYGGEEFGIILVDTDAEEARAACERFRRVVAGVRVPAPDGSTVGVTASFGAATVTDVGAKRADLIAAADEALYAAKNAGRNRVVTIGPLVVTIG